MRRFFQLVFFHDVVTFLKSVVLEAGITGNLTGNVTGGIVGNVSATTLIVSTGGVPATADATGTRGMVRIDADYIYVCTATDTWKRVAIETWGL